MLILKSGKYLQTFFITQYLIRVSDERVFECFQLEPKYLLLKNKTSDRNWFLLNCEYHFEIFLYFILIRIISS